MEPGPELDTTKKLQSSLSRWRRCGVEVLNGKACFRERIGELPEPARKDGAQDGACRRPACGPVVETLRPLRPGGMRPHHSWADVGSGLVLRSSGTNLTKSPKNSPNAYIQNESPEKTCEYEYLRTVEDGMLRDESERIAHYV